MEINIGEAGWFSCSLFLHSSTRSGCLQGPLDPCRHLQELQHMKNVSISKLAKAMIQETRTSRSKGVSGSVHQGRSNGGLRAVSYFSVVMINYPEEMKGGLTLCQVPGAVSQEGQVTATGS